MSERLNKRVRVYYEDEVYDGPVSGIPSPVGVVVVVADDVRNSAYETGRLVLRTGEYYLYKQGYWFPLYSDVDLIDHLLHCQVDKVLKGRWVADPIFEAIIKEAMTTSKGDWPRKSCHRNGREGERRRVKWANL